MQSLLSLLVKEFGKLVNIWRSYGWDLWVRVGYPVLFWLTW